MGYTGVGTEGLTMGFTVARPAHGGYDGVPPGGYELLVQRTLSLLTTEKPLPLQSAAS